MEAALAPEFEMFVENREPRVHCIADLPLKKNQKPSEPGSPPPPADALLPGMNEVDDAVWNECAMKIPLVRYMVDKSILVPIVNRTAKEIARLSGPDAIELVRGTFDKVLLLKYKRTDKRAAVLEAIDKQIEVITPKEIKD